MGIFFWPSSWREASPLRAMDAGYILIYIYGYSLAWLHGTFTVETISFSILRQPHSFSMVWGVVYRYTRNGHPTWLGTRVPNPPFFFWPKCQILIFLGKTTCKSTNSWLSTRFWNWFANHSWLNSDLFDTQTHHFFLFDLSCWCLDSDFWLFLIVQSQCLMVKNHFTCFFWHINSPFFVMINGNFRILKWRYCTI